MTTRFGRIVQSKTCPNERCRNYGNSMSDIGSREYINHYCHWCGCHYDGNVGEELKFWTEKEWEDAIEEAWGMNKNKP